MSQFVGNLKNAISEEEASIREVDINPSGSYRKVVVITETDGKPSELIERSAFIDLLGRVVVPSEAIWEMATSIRFLDETVARRVCRREHRWDGDEITTTVLYLENQ